MNIALQPCLCQDQHTEAEYGCTCGISITFLCKACLSSHLAQSGTHPIISVSQAFELKNSGSDFKLRYNKVSHHLSDYKVQTKEYIDKIDSFISQINEDRELRIHQISSVSDKAIKYLEALKSNLLVTIDQMNTSIVSSDFEIFEKYERNERGILEGYPQNFHIDEETFQETLASLIVFGQEEQPRNRTKKDLELEIQTLNESLQVYQNLEDIQKSKIEELQKEVHSYKEKAEASTIECSQLHDRIGHYEEIFKDKGYDQRKPVQRQDSYSHQNGKSAPDFKNGFHVSEYESAKSRGFQISVRIFRGNTITMNVESSDTVEKLIAKIEEKEGIPRNQQRLIYAGGHLKESKLLKYYRIEEGSVLDLINPLA